MTALPAFNPSSLQEAAASAIGAALADVGVPALYRAGDTGEGVLVSIVVGPDADSFRGAGGRNRVPGPGPAGASGVNAPWRLEIPAGQVAEVSAGDSFEVRGGVVGTGDESVRLVVTGLPRFGGAVWDCRAAIAK